MLPTSETTSSMTIFDKIMGYEHEQVVFCHDKDSGLRSIIAIHNTVLGPSLGGTRMWNYDSEVEALDDVLRLSRAMTFKASICGINLGGGKAVIIGDPYTDKSDKLLASYGKYINSLNGKYITAEDVGTSTDDIRKISEQTKFVSGLPEEMGGSGDPAPFTAYSTYLGMKASAKEVWGNDSLGGKKVVVQGVGHVGENLVDYLVKDGAIVSITDIHDSKIENVLKKHELKVLNPDEIYDIETDFYSPCALGATINDDTINRFKCSIIAGAANNQLKDEVTHAEMLQEKAILYTPDFLINAGGVINVYMELEGYDREKVMSKTEEIYDRTLNIFKKASAENITTHQAAMDIAKERIKLAKLEKAEQV